MMTEILCFIIYYYNPLRVCLCWQCTWWAEVKYRSPHSNSSASHERQQGIIKLHFIFLAPYFYIYNGVLFVRKSHIYLFSSLIDDW